MRAWLRYFAVIAAALALGACGTSRTPTRIDRVVCPPAALDVASPVTGNARNGETLEGYEARVAADDLVSSAALRAWATAFRECSRR